jgi:hypothetical protein
MKSLVQSRRILGFRFEQSRLSSARVLPLVDALVIVAFLLDLLAPFLVWKGFLPDSVTSLTQILVAAAIVFAYTRMMILHRIPGAVWALLGISAIGITVAIFRGQGLAATLWGWWNLFKYPMLGIYAYLRLHWPDDFAKKLMQVCFGLVVLEAVFQVGQYLLGEPIGDNLAGTFGWHGVRHIFFLTCLALSWALGLWVVERRWSMLLLILGLGAVSNVLAENKIFPAAALAMAAVSIGLYVAQGQRGQLSRLLLFAILMVAGVWAFTAGYNEFVPGADRRPLQSLFVEDEAREDYLNKVKRSQTAEQQTYNLGRNNAFSYSLSTLSGDMVSLGFGFGLGARSQSDALGVTGTALKSDKFDRGSQLAAMLQEMGLFGLLVVVGFTVWVSVKLWLDIRRYPQSQALALRYGLLLFSLFWPVWLWYKNPLGARVAMTLYWVALGYVLSEPHLESLSDAQ